MKEKQTKNVLLQYDVEDSKVKKLQITKQCQFKWDLQLESKIIAEDLQLKDERMNFQEKIVEFDKMLYQLEDDKNNLGFKNNNLTL